MKNLALKPWALVPSMLNKALSISCKVRGIIKFLLKAKGRTLSDDSEINSWKCSLLLLPIRLLSNLVPVVEYKTSIELLTCLSFIVAKNTLLLESPAHSHCIFDFCLRILSSIWSHFLRESIHCCSWVCKVACYPSETEFESYPTSFWHPQSSQLHLQMSSLKMFDHPANCFQFVPNINHIICNSVMSQQLYHEIEGGQLND